MHKTYCHSIFHESLSRLIMHDSQYCMYFMVSCFSALSYELVHSGLYIVSKGVCSHSSTGRAVALSQQTILRNYVNCELCVHIFANCVHIFTFFYKSCNIFIYSYQQYFLYFSRF